MGRQREPRGISHALFPIALDGLDSLGMGDQASSEGRLIRRAAFDRAMTLPRRRFLQLAAGAVALPALSRIASAQAYPARPVRIILGFAPGGAADASARVIGQWLSERLGQQFVIENRTGAGGNIATDAVVR